MNNLAKIEVTNDLKESITKVVSEIGGFEKFIKPGDVVLVKPNYNTADPFPASTQLDFLKTIIQLIYAQNPKLVIVGESSTMTANTKKVLEASNVYSLLEMDPAPRILAFEEKKWIKKTIPNGKYLKSMHVPEILDRVDKIIMLPCLKTHFAAQFTGSLKLAVAFMKPHQRVALHMRHIQEKIAEMNLLFKPDLILMDARKCFINKGPCEGEVKSPNQILASTSRIDIDIEGIKIIQTYENNSLKNIKPAELIQIKYARDLGIK